MQLLQVPHPSESQAERIVPGNLHFNRFFEHFSAKQLEDFCRRPVYLNRVSSIWS